MNQEDILEYAISGIEMLETAAIAYETGRPDILEQLSQYSFDRDDEWEFSLDGMDKLCDFMAENFSDQFENCTMYFSSYAMMEYYLLCREYSKLKGIPLEANPYMRRAKSEVYKQMHENGCYYCCYYLQTKVNHKWASGIVFRYDTGYFCEFLALFSRLLYVFEFYAETVKELRSDVENLNQEQQQSQIKILSYLATERRAA